MRNLILGATLALAAVPFVPAAAQAQPAAGILLDGTRLDVVATGEVSRVPDIARITAGVVTVAPSATAALAQRMLKNPLGQIFAHEFSVTGGWAEPQVARLNPPETPGHPQVQ